MVFATLERKRKRKQKGYRETATHFIFKDVFFKKPDLTKILASHGWAPGDLCMSVLLAGPNAADIDSTTKLLQYVFIAKGSRMPVVLPHPRWFHDKMALPALDKAATLQLNPQKKVPAFFC